MHDLVIGGVFLAMLVAPCVATIFHKDEKKA
jgi:hypothetical protein